MMVMRVKLLMFFFVVGVAEAARRAKTSTAPPKTQFDYAQSDYDVVLERAVFPSYNTSYMKYVRGGFVPYNRTHRVLNYTAESIRDIKTLQIDFQVYKFMSNEYRFFPISVTVNACREYQLNAFRSKEILPLYSNLNPCHLIKGSYYVRNGIADFNKFPPYIPRGSYKMVGRFSDSDGSPDSPYFVVQADFYGSIKDKTPTY